MVGGGGRERGGRRGVVGEGDREGEFGEEGRIEEVEQWFTEQGISELIKPIVSSQISS